MRHCTLRMKNPTYLKWIMSAWMGALASCAPQSKPSEVPASAPLHPDTSLAGKVFQEVNSYRRSHGASALKRHAGLDHLAQEHSEYLRKYRGTFKIEGNNVSHIGFDGRALVARKQYRMLSLGENIAATKLTGKNTAPHIVRMWSISTLHDLNMLNDWTHTGIGVVVDSDGMVFSTQLFATANFSQRAARQRFSSF